MSLPVVAINGNGIVANGIIHGGFGVSNAWDTKDGITGIGFGAEAPTVAAAAPAGTNAAGIGVEQVAHLEVAVGGDLLTIVHAGHVQDFTSPGTVGGAPAGVAADDDGFGGTGVPQTLHNSVRGPVCLTVHVSHCHPSSTTERGGGSVALVSDGGAAVFVSSLPAAPAPVVGADVDVVDGCITGDTVSMLGSKQNSEPAVPVRYIR
jgi:hypothetical protein